MGVEMRMPAPKSGAMPKLTPEEVRALASRVGIDVAKIAARQLEDEDRA
jgi:hypothetical protein